MLPRHSGSDLTTASDVCFWHADWNIPPAPSNTRDFELSQQTSTNKLTSYFITVSSKTTSSRNQKNNQSNHSHIYERLEVYTTVHYNNRVKNGANETTVNL